MIYVYLWLAGMAGGAYMAAFLAERFSGQSDRKLLQLASYMGIPLAIIGVLLLVIELGHPFRFWELLTQFRVMSPMSMGTWILTLWVIIACAISVFTWLSNRSAEAARSLNGLTGFLGWINLALAVLLIAYTGVLLGNSNQPLWAGSILLPALFVASAISTGVALLILAGLVLNSAEKGKMVELRLVFNTIFGHKDWTVPSQTISRLAEADAIVILIELAILIGYAIWLGASGLVGAGEGLRILTTGVLAAPFWIGVVLLALLIPLWLDVANWGKEIEAKGVWPAVTASSMCVILGGLVLRAVITIGGQM
jgi:formate-dependent nitrite reductase membrane component NrfD